VTTNDRQRYEVILAGTGGQGLVLSGMVLSEAAILEGRNTVQTQSYGIASRGGLSIAEVIIDPREIIYQQVTRPDVILALSEETLNKYAGFIDQGVTVFYDSTLAKPRVGTNLFGFPFTRIASDLGNAATVNMVSLGALLAKCPLVGYDSLVRVLQKRFAAPAAESNRKALQLGVELVQGP
jgi:2-oxoglutarate ferredoxin oxidoreductase subunit gamma